MIRIFSRAGAVLALGLAQPVLASPSGDLAAVIADHWSWYLATNPTVASGLGVRDHGAKLEDPSLLAADRAAHQAKGFLARLDAIPDRDLRASEQTDKAILKLLLAEQVEANSFGQRAMLFTTYSSPHQNFAGLGENLPFETRADYGDYLARLGAFPDVNRTVMAVTRAALKQGYVQPCLALGGFGVTISGAVSGPAEKTRLYAPFAVARPSFVGASEWADLQSRAAALIRDKVAPEYRVFAEFYLKEYMPKCRATVSASALPQGAAWYASRVRVHTTTTLSVESIHQTGLNEVARIRARMEAVAKQAGYPDRAAMVAELRRNPRYYATSPAELMGVAARTAKQIDGLMPRYFGRLPRLPYGLKEIPKETAETTTTAYYSPGSPPAGLAGNYYVNTSKLDQRPLFELPALTAHEAVPGHHHQIALQQELDVPEFRKHLAGFTAFVEGWGLYAEYLGEEMGLYDSPEKMMGRLSYEMWRACRLVVDTGIHAKGWSKERAISFMRDNTALSAANIEAEVNRYISWPGQALGYKLGEIRIRELRRKAESELGPRFDLRRFHDAVLEQGAVPLDVLSQQIEGWIATERARPEPPHSPRL